MESESASVGTCCDQLKGTAIGGKEGDARDTDISSGFTIAIPIRLNKLASRRTTQNAA